jgi:hypothetical protein
MGLRTSFVEGHSTVPPYHCEPIGRLDLRPGQKIQAIAVGGRIEFLPVRWARKFRGMDGVEFRAKPGSRSS